MEFYFHVYGLVVTISFLEYRKCLMFLQIQLNLIEIEKKTFKKFLLYVKRKKNIYLIEFESIEAYN